MLVIVIVIVMVMVMCVTIMLVAMCLACGVMLRTTAIMRFRVLSMRFVHVGMLSNLACFHNSPPEKCRCGPVIVTYNNRSSRAMPC